MGAFSKLLVLTLVGSLASLGAGQGSQDENRHFAMFSPSAPSGWTGTDHWKWTPNVRNRMALTGAPDTGDDNSILVLDHSKGKSGTLVSPALESRPGFSCLYFNYYIRLPNYQDNGLTLSIASSGGHKRQLWASTAEDLDIWQTGEVEIPRGDIAKFIEFTGTQGGVGTIALNGFFLRDGKCQDRHPVDCDFESEGLCGWTTNNAVHQSKAGDQKIFTEKPEDHTTDSLFGHTALFAARENAAHLLSPVFQPTFHKCFTFAFMTNSKTIHPEVYSKGRTSGFTNRLWSPDQSKDYALNHWHLVEIPVELSQIDQFQIQIKNVESMTNAIRIDDIQMRPYCSNPEGAFQNFQYGFGEWKSDKKDSLRWNIGKGRQAGRLDGSINPPHPIGVYTDFSQIGSKSRSRMELTSGYVPRSNIYKCLRFDFLVQNFGDNDQFYLQRVDPSGRTDQLWNFSIPLYQEGVMTLAEPILVPGIATLWEYRLRFVAETNNPQMSAAIFKVQLEPSLTKDCVMRKDRDGGKVTPKPDTPTQAPERKTKLDPSNRALVSSLLKNVRSEIMNIMHIVKDKEDIVYELVGEVDGGVDRALKAVSM